MPDAVSENLSPCRRLCRLDLAGRRCVDCARTLDEIATWSKLTTDERKRIMGELPQRLRQVETDNS
ncbi:MAG: DUF1289 domain-containing protein [Leptospirales bacterium]|nr:DUF1289 domain-containing protein [Leptospirales bacterium]